MLNQKLLCSSRMHDGKCTWQHRIPTTTKLNALNRTLNVIKMSLNKLRGCFRWYQCDFNSDTSSHRFLRFGLDLVALYLFTWYLLKRYTGTSRTGTSSPPARSLYRIEIFIPARKLILKSCKRGLTVHFIYLFVSSISLQNTKLAPL